MDSVKTPRITKIERSEEKSENAYRLLFNWNDCVAECEKEYVERARKIKLLGIMKKVIENELDEGQRKILKMKYADGKSAEGISRELGMSPSSVLRNLKKSEKIIGAYMKYAVVFSDLGMKNDEKPLDVRMAIADLMLEHAGKDEIGARLSKSRRRALISPQKAALCTGITEKRIAEIEKTGLLSVGELKKLTSFYSVSADYIVFGAE